MEVAELRGLRGRLDRYLRWFRGCIRTRPTRRHLRTYLKGQLGPVGKKNVEVMALEAGVPVRTLQEFLEIHRWEEGAVGRRVRERVRRRHGHDNAIAVVDETSFVKAGHKTAGVKRQYCGASGKVDNCVVSVHLGYVAGDFHAPLDADLYLPEDWAGDAERRREAGIPASVEYRPKWRIALDLISRSREEGVALRWVTADETYGRVGEFRDTLSSWGLHYVVEIPRDLTGWTRRPRLESAEDAALEGRPRLHARLAPGERRARPVEALWRRGGPSWELYRVKDTDKGPVVWRVRESRLFPSAGGLPGEAVRLIVARAVLEDEVKYFLSNAPEEVPLKEVLCVAFSRCEIEQLFREAKGEVGLDQFQVRKYRPLMRHLVLSNASLLFLAEQTQRLRGEKPVVERLPGPGGDRGATRSGDVGARADAAAGESPAPDRLRARARREGSAPAPRAAAARAAGRGDRPASGHPVPDPDLALYC